MSQNSNSNDKIQEKNESFNAAAPQDTEELELLQKILNYTSRKHSFKESKSETYLTIKEKNPNKIGKRRHSSNTLSEDLLDISYPGLNTTSSNKNLAQVKQKIISESSCLPFSCLPGRRCAPVMNHSSKRNFAYKGVSFDTSLLHVEIQEEPSPLANLLSSPNSFHQRSNYYITPVPPGYLPMPGDSEEQLNVDTKEPSSLSDIFRDPRPSTSTFLDPWHDDNIQEIYRSPNEMIETPPSLSDTEYNQNEVVSSVLKLKCSEADSPPTEVKTADATDQNNLKIIDDSSDDSI